MSAVNRNKSAMKNKPANQKKSVDKGKSVLGNMPADKPKTGSEEKFKEPEPGLERREPTESELDTLHRFSAINRRWLSNDCKENQPEELRLLLVEVKRIMAAYDLTSEEMIDLVHCRVMDKAIGERGLHLDTLSREELMKLVLKAERGLWNSEGSVLAIMQTMQDELKVQMASAFNERDIAAKGESSAGKWSKRLRPRDATQE